MIFDRIEWDEYNLDTDSILARSGSLGCLRIRGAFQIACSISAAVSLLVAWTDGGKFVVVIVQVLHDGVRPITGWEA